ncbi:MAG: winged helix-turn-helix domain-containing protein [Bryobacteraceae bacterium]|jgi:DNA-binding response OmpR family regulator
MEPLWAANTSREPYRDARLTIDFAHRAVALDSQSIALTAKEYLLLSFLAAHSGEIFTRTDLLLAIWGYGGQIRTRTLDVHLARLRKKLGPFGHRHLESVCGNGCRYQPPREPREVASPLLYRACAAVGNPIELGA